MLGFAQASEDIIAALQCIVVEDVYEVWGGRAPSNTGNMLACILMFDSFGRKFLTSYTILSNIDCTVFVSVTDQSVIEGHYSGTGGDS